MTKTKSLTFNLNKYKKTMKSSDQLLKELDLLIEADFKKAKAELEQLKNSPSVFTIFTLEENNVNETFEQIYSIFASDEEHVEYPNYAKSTIA